MPKKEEGMFDILMRFTLKNVDLFKDGVISDQGLVWGGGRVKRAILFEGTCFVFLLLIFACFLETASQSCVGR